MFSCFFRGVCGAVGSDRRRSERIEIFDQKNVAIETVCLLLSSFTCGLASIAADVRNKLWFYIAMAVTCSGLRS